MRPSRAPRLRALGGVLLAAGLVTGLTHAPASAAGAPAAAPPVTQTSGSLKQEIAAINAEMARVGEELARGAAAYEDAEDALARVTQQQFAARADQESLIEAEVVTRDAISGLARSAYKGTLPPMLAALLSGDPRAMSDLAYVQRSVGRVSASHSELADGLVAQQVGAGQAVQRADELRKQALAQRQDLERQRLALAEQTTRLTEQLRQAGARLIQVYAQEQEVARAKMAAAQRVAAERAAVLARQQAVTAGIPLGAGDTGLALCQPPSSFGLVNGFLPGTSLCALDTAPGHRLRTDAARAFDALSRARQAATGQPLCVTDSYRSYAAQVDVFRRKPDLAATPGRSQHGWGLALDLCGGVQTFGAEAHRWMQVNAPAYGWIHPGWARQNGSRPEAWHWEYVGVVVAAR